MPADEPYSHACRTPAPTAHPPPLTEEPVLAWLRADDNGGRRPVMPAPARLSMPHGSTPSVNEAVAAPLTASSSSSASPPRHAASADAHRAAVDPVMPMDEARLDRFFEGLAAGESMDSLVHVLHNVMQVHYQKLLTAPASDAHDTHDDTAQTRPPASALSITQHRRTARSAAPAFTRAVTAAMVFALESPAASAEATNLYFSSPVRAVIAHEHGEPVSSGSPAHSAVTTPLSTTLCRHVAFPALPVRPRAVRHLLSDRAASRLARACWRHDDNDNNSDTVRGSSVARRRALAILNEAQPSRETASTWVELHSRAGDWQRALHLLESYVPAAEWGQRELSACVRAMYHAARAASARAATDTTRKRAVGRRAAGSATLAMLSDAVVTYPVHLLERAAQAREARLLNETRAHVREAEVEETERPETASSTTSAAVAAMNASMTEHALPSAVNDALGLLSLRPDLWRDACRLLDDFVLHRDACAAHTSDNHESTARRTNEADRAHAVAWGVTPNAITVHQTCRALRADWRVALDYASRLLRAHPDIALANDAGAFRSYLDACLDGADWRGAMAVVSQHLTLTSDGTTARASASRAAKAPPAAPDVLLRVVHLFNQQQATRELSARLAEQLAHSKHYNKHTRSRALNSLLQHSTTAAEAEGYAQQIDALIATQRRTPRRGQTASPSTTSASVVLENESLARLVHLQSHDGAWEKALESLHRLLEDPQRQASFVPSAQVHDEVQFAMAQAPAPGPSWAVTLGLFWRMCEGRDVPVSSVAFRAVAARCQSQGAISQYEQLMHFLVKRGVRR